MISIKHKGNFIQTETLLKNALKPNYVSILDKYGREGVSALASATPTDTGNTANSWVYKIRYNKYGVSLEWSNTNVSNNIPVVILIEYGHGTRNGGYVQGREFINQTLKPIFDKMSNDIWREVIK